MKMNSGKKVLLAAVMSGLMFAFINCKQFYKREAPAVEFEAKILTDPMSVRTKLGDYVAGYLAEYSLDFQRHTIFMALEIQKYEKNERLAVGGSFTDDSVSIAYGGHNNVDYPVFHVQKAAPPKLDKRIEKILSLIRGPQ